MKPFALGLFMVGILGACSHQVEVRGGGGAGGGCSEERPLTAPSECGGDWSCVDGSWVFQPRDCPPDCPAEPPLTAKNCSPEEEGRFCDYFTFACDAGGPSLSFNCFDGIWEEVPTGCQVCPPDAPVVGTDCSDWPEATFCSYSAPTICGTTGVDVGCESSTERWLSFSGSSTCGEGCGDYVDEVGCAADGACRWLVPGCGPSPNPLSTAGCFPAAPCTPSTCGAGASCETVTYDPCTHLDCNACGAETTVCIQI